ncbi:hypothetical protein JTE90_026516 [Oedothorax gibbosus]|uniref:Uncharacterized protein n=1 Tax=Oedothorax gibbosus TaxID=931172 RepID=A0AAV6VPU9_9ARAC|nr:hypothetical protein JTE90_026516 [Oedothorax gibbosus]
MSENCFRFRELTRTNPYSLSIGSDIHFTFATGEKTQKRSLAKSCVETDGNRPQQVKFRSKIDQQVNKREDAPTGDHEQSDVSIETSGCRVRDSHSGRGCRLGDGARTWRVGVFDTWRCFGRHCCAKSNAGLSFYFINAFKFDIMTIIIKYFINW